MRPSADTQIRWGLGAAAVAFALIALLAFAPDPLFRQRIITTTIDDVEQLSPRRPDLFSGRSHRPGPVGSAGPGDPRFVVRLGVRRDWTPTPCSYVQINGANPLTPPRVELVALETTPNACPMARALANCDLEPHAATLHGEAIAGCRRTAGFFQSATAAVAQVASVARSANALTARLQAALPAGDGRSLDLKALATSATSTLAAANELTQRLDRSLAPGQGDVALTLANARRASGHVADIDVASLNQSLVQMKTLLTQNQASVTALLDQSRSVAGDSRVLLENLSSSLIESSGNLQRASDNLDRLTARVADDPGYVLRGQKFADPPAPGGAP